MMLSSFLSISYMPESRLLLVRIGRVSFWLFDNKGISPKKKVT